MTHLGEGREEVGWVEGEKEEGKEEGDWAGEDLRENF